jgi:hypothetical protein
VSRARIVWVVLVVLTVIVVGVGVWFFVRDEYPFQQVGDDDVVGLTYDRGGPGSRVIGYVGHPPRDLPGWVRSWERNSGGDETSVEAVVTVLLRDGRRLRLEVGGARGYACWIGADGRAGESFGGPFNEAFIWYIRGLGVGLDARPPVEPSPTPQ